MGSAEVVAAYAIGVPFFVFHMSVTLCIIRQRMKKHHSLQSAFYLVYVHTSVIDLFSYVLAAMLAFFVFERRFPPETIRRFGKILLCLMPYTRYVQNVGHVIVALNRYTIFVFPDKHRQIWSGWRMRTFLGMMYGVPALCISFHVVNDMNMTIEEGVVMLTWSPAWLYPASVIVMACFALVTSLLCAYLTLMTLSAYRRMSTERRNNDEYRLLIFAMTQLVGQILTAVCYTMGVISYFLQSADVAALSQAFFAYLTDVLCFGGPQNIATRVFQILRPKVEVGFAGCFCPTDVMQPKVPCSKHGAHRQS